MLHGKFFETEAVFFVVHRNYGIIHQGAEEAQDLFAAFLDEFTVFSNAVWGIQIKKIFYRSQDHIEISRCPGAADDGPNHASRTPPFLTLPIPPSHSRRKSERHTFLYITLANTVCEPLPVAAAHQATALPISYNNLTGALLNAPKPILPPSSSKEINACASCLHIAATVVPTFASFQEDLTIICPYSRYSIYVSVCRTQNLQIFTTVDISVDIYGYYKKVSILVDKTYRAC